MTEKKLTLDEMAQKIVRDEVFYCISSLISDLNTLVSSADHNTLKKVSVDQDQLMSLSVQDDWQEPAEDYINALDREDLINELELKDIEFDQSDDDKALAKKLTDYLEEEDEWQEFCSDNRLDPHTIEVYEHWIVSNWLANKLEERGGIVDRDVCGLTVWGRTTTGQLAYMDWIIQQIAKDLLEDADKPVG